MKINIKNLLIMFGINIISLGISYIIPGMIYLLTKNKFLNPLYIFIGLLIFTLVQLIFVNYLM
jgi:hypothetical protein